MTLSAHIPALIVLIPLLLAAPVALIWSNLLAWVFALLATGLSAVAAIIGLITHDGIAVSYHLGGWEPPWGIEFVADSASLLVAAIISCFCFVATFYAKIPIEKEIHAPMIPKAYGAWLLAIGGLLGLVMTGDAFNLFIFLEISSLATVTLIALGGGHDRRALIAAFNYLMVGSIGATFYVIGVGFCYAMTGTLNMADLAMRLPLASSSAPIFVGFAFIVAGLLVKAAVFPVHVWLPAAYGYAPSAVSAMLAAVSTKAAIYALARIIFTVFADTGISSLILEWVILPLSLMAIFVGTILAIMESDLKKLLAQSSIAQIGYITLGLTLGNIAGVSASFIHIVNHALIKGGMFMAIGAIALSLMPKRVSITRIKGFGRAMPITATALTICGLSLIGLPLTAGFISKVYLILALASVSAWWIVGLVVLSSALAFIYLWRIVEAVWMQPFAAKKTIKAENPMIYLPLWVIALANIWLGIDATSLIEFSQNAAVALGRGR